MSKSKYLTTDFESEEILNINLIRDENPTELKAPHKTQNLNKTQIGKINKIVHKNYKYVYKKCGAFIPPFQFICGMCISTNRRKIKKAESQQLCQDMLI